MVGFLILSGFLQVQAQTQDTITIEVGGYLWNKTTLNVLIVSQNQSDWHTSLVNSTIRAIEDWNHAIQIFSTNYSSFSYLSTVNLQVQVSDTMKPDFEIYVNFSESVILGSEDAIGSTTTIPYGNGTIQNCLILLAEQSQYISLTEKDIQNVATHEFGHALGIGHSNSSTDLMYPLYDVYAPQYEISTLNMYGVANAFQWIVNPNQPVPSPRQELYLPDNITYEYIPSVEPAPRSLTDNPILRALEVIANVLTTPYILLIIVVGISLMVLIELYFRRKGKAKNRINI
ncbi:MAG: matrixin family metalloprotease [Candidatus Bathyarchaeia archaeon]